MVHLFNHGSGRVNGAFVGQIGEILSLAAPWGAPMFAYVFAVALFVEEDSSAWHTVIAIFATAAITLGGIVYRDMQRRLKDVEEKHEKDTEEFQDRLEASNAQHALLMDRYARRQERMVGVLLGVAISASSNAEGGEDRSERMMDQIRALMEREP